MVLSSICEIKRELWGLKPLQEGMSWKLGAKSLFSLWCLKSGDHRRWPWPHLWVSQLFQVTTHLWTHLPVCLGCGLHSLDRGREKLKWQRQVFMLEKFLCHLQQIIAQMHQKENQSVKSTSPSRNRAVEIPGILSAPSQNTQEKPNCP